jgi:hypothetical protein
VDPRRAGKTRRWQPAIVVVAALGLFAALIAGSALRPQFSAAALPEPAAWSHAAADAVAPTGHPQLHGSPQLANQVAGCLCGSGPVNKKPFHSMWMTQDRPQTWPRWSPESARSPSMPSFAPAVFSPDGTGNRSPAYSPDGQDLLTRLCVTRC